VTLVQSSIRLGKSAAAPSKASRLPLGKAPVQCRLTHLSVLQSRVLRCGALFFGRGR
jgi:hypothetical protein